MTTEDAALLWAREEWPVANGQTAMPLPAPPAETVKG